METPVHTLGDLFAQLGLPTEGHEIERFIERHRPLPDGMLLPDAPFWSTAQSQFLREEWREDADWAPLVDQLNVRLR